MGAHHHHHHEERHAPRGAAGRALLWALGATLAFAAVEAASGLVAGSLALLSDAGHMLSDALALGVAALAAALARRPPSRRHSYGLARAEVVAALANALLMLAVIVGIVVEAVHRFADPQPVRGGIVMAVALAGLAVNLAVAWTLARAEQSINIRAALLHVMGDLLGSVAALTAGAVVFFTGWTPIDPLLSLAVAALILVSTVRVLRGALHILMEGVPAELDLEEVGRAMAGVEGVRGVHDLHIWTLSSGRVALSAHVEMAELGAWPRVLAATRRLLARRYGIDHVTLQPEVPVRIEQPYANAIPIRSKKP